MSEVLSRIDELGVVPVIVIDDPENADELAVALTDGGLPCAEVTFRTAAAGDALRRMANHRPDLLLGAGTVLSVAQAEEALDAGARFIVSPGLDPELVAFCQERSVPVIPGVATPTEIQHALGLGLEVLKLFPAGTLGGVKYLKAVSAPFPQLRFIPTGGVSADNMADYLALPSVAAVGGSWIAPKGWIAEGAFERIRESAAAAVKSVEVVRSGGGK
jgi:2-dehydro-3-deoxyphosphogluconate aldolase/(4S)-4-hydroxy-2-oxoglutarate aldolase